MSLPRFSLFLHSLIVLFAFATLVMILSRASQAEDVDPRLLTFTVGTVVGPFHGGNSWPYAGIGIAISLPTGLATSDNAAAHFMDWQTLQAVRVDAALTLKLSSITFPFDSTTVDISFSKYISLIAQFLADNPEVSLSLEGHTDPVGDSPYNEDLGFHRAIAIKDALVASGVDESRLWVFSYGESQQLLYGTAPAKEQRRVEILPFRSY